MTMSAVTDDTGAVILFKVVSVNKPVVPGSAQGTVSANSLYDSSALKVGHRSLSEFTVIC